MKKLQIIYNKWLAKFIIKQLQKVKSEVALRVFNHGCLLEMNKQCASEIEMTYTCQIGEQYFKVVTNSKGEEITKEEFDILQSDEKTN